MKHVDLTKAGSLWYIGMGGTKNGPKDFWGVDGPTSIHHVQHFRTYAAAEQAYADAGLENPWTIVETFDQGIVFDIHRG